MWILILGILLGIGIFTGISAKNYGDSLIKVNVVDPTSGTITTTLNVKGNIVYNETKEIELPAGCEVEVVFAEKGAYLEAGSPIMKLREADVQILYLQKMLQKESYEKTVEAGGLQGELASWQLINLEEELVWLEGLLADDCVISGDVPCQVLRQSCKEGDRAAAGSLIQLGLTESGCYLTWSVGAGDYGEYKHNVKINGTLHELEWDAPLVEDGQFIFTSQLPTESGYRHGQQVEVELQWESDKFNSVIPRQCIRYDSEGIAYVYELAEREKIYGTEKYVKKVSIAIQAENERYAGVTTWFDSIVYNPSEELTDGKAVKE